VLYGERLFVGYRHYESVAVPVRYPFGHGLTYTSFAYADLRASAHGVQLTVTNTGSRPGRDVVQVYVGAPGGPGIAPRRELRGFVKVTLQPGESRRVRVELDARAFQRWQPGTGWVEVGGEHTVEVGTSAHDIVLATAVRRRGPTPAELTMDSPLSDFLAHPVTGPILARAARGVNGGGADPLAMVAGIPLWRMARFPGAEGLLGLRRLLPIANNRVVRAVAGWFRR
jgi:beta-glucosidase